MTTREPPNYRIHEQCINCKFLVWNPFTGKCCKRYPEFYNDSEYVCDDYEAESGEGREG